MSRAKTTKKKQSKPSSTTKPSTKKSFGVVKKTSQKETAPSVVTYDVKKDDQKKLSSDGYIKHPWYKLAIAAIIGVLFGWLFRKFKK